MPRKKKQEPDQPVSDRQESADPLHAAVESAAAVDAEAELVAAASDTFDQASNGGTEPVVAEATMPVEECVSLEEDVAVEEMDGLETDEEPALEPAGGLERLQKILAKAGIASRRHAEELITDGRVQVNGKVVTELGSKANPDRDHIRVDGKLLQGSERHRYFMLNKPKGYVTTVSDPEGRPTIMEFFAKTRERLYPVGRLDYLSEGLLLVTNDGELANKLTRAASNVEKTYLAKVSGQPSEEDLDRLRQGVGIDRGKPGSGRVQTAPAQIRLFRPGKAGGQRGTSRFGHNTGSSRTGPGPRGADNPWYEVVLIEGRNRELRKMFEEIGHHVEKIRRIGYGPLELDLEPGKIRELDPQEIENLRKAAEGKYRKPKSREPRKREFSQRTERPAAKPRWNERQSEGRYTRDAEDREGRTPFRKSQRNFESRPQSGRSGPSQRDRFQSEPRREFRPGTRPPASFSEQRPQRPSPLEDQVRHPFTGGSRENRGRFAQPQSRDRGAKPAWNKLGRGSRPPQFDRTSGTNRSERPNRFQRTDRLARGDFRPTSSEGRPKRFDRQRSAAPPRDFSSRKKLDIQPLEETSRSPETRFEDRQRRDRPPFKGRGGPRPDRSRFQGPPSGRNQQPRRPSTEPRRSDRDRQNRPEESRFDRPRRNERSGEFHANRPARPERRSDQRPGNPHPGSNSRPGTRGGPRGGKRGAPGGKQGSVRSGDGRRPGSRPGGNRGNKLRP